MNSEFLSEVSRWKLEAKLEDNNRYFYHTKIIDRILEGDKLYIIGRKGTGKTAISEYLSALKPSGVHCQKLTFKSFPFNTLYALNDKGFTPPNQYITLWKYVIYSTTCRLMATNQAIDPETRDKLRAIFSDDIERALPTAVERWTSFKFDIKILGSGVAGEGKREKGNVESLDWISKVEILERFLLDQIGADRYIIVFDELDEDYKDILHLEKNKQYTELLTGLFKAAQDIRSRFSKFKYYPVIFLRDDIYDILQDPDKTKWTDYRVDLEWDEQLIKNMLAFRLSRALSRDGELLEFGKIWSMLFSSDEVKFGNHESKSMKPFDFITRSTFLRPRDYIRYLQICSSKSLDRGSVQIDPAIIVESDPAFSNYLRSELEDELHGIYPDIHQIFEIFTTLRKQTCRIIELKEVYEDSISDGRIAKRDFKLVLQVLFHFSAIGNLPKQQNHAVFRYKNKDATLNLRENITIHRGLFRALQLV